MVRKKNNGYGICVYDDELNHSEFVVDVISNAFGYHKTQAYQCVNMIEINGKYIVKKYTSKEHDKALKFTNFLVQNGLLAEIISL
jgi:ATP-dependent Clp protease adapter protein ClpS